MIKLFILALGIFSSSIWAQDEVRPINYKNNFLQLRPDSEVEVFYHWSDLD